MASVEGTVRLLEGRAIFQGQLVFACEFPFKGGGPTRGIFPFLLAGSLGVPGCRAVICSQRATVGEQIDQITLPLKSVPWN